MSVESKPANRIPLPYRVLSGNILQLRPKDSLILVVPLIPDCVRLIGVSQPQSVTQPDTRQSSLELKVLCPASFRPCS